jgi:putative endonuclease
LANRPSEYGKGSEALAAEFLEKRGYTMVEKNFRTRRGELDLIALDGDFLVFVEVKARRSSGYGEPHWAVTEKKRRHLIHASQLYLARKRLTKQLCRFDLVVIQETREGESKIELIRNAFEVEPEFF